MDNKKMTYDQQMAEYKERMLRRNRQIMEDDDDIIDSIIAANEPKVEVKKREFVAPVRTNLSGGSVAKPTPVKVEKPKTVPKPEPAVTDSAFNIPEEAPVKEAPEPEVPEEETSVPEPEELYSGLKAESIPDVKLADVISEDINEDYVEDEPEFAPAPEEDKVVTPSGIILPNIKKMKENAAAKEEKLLAADVEPDVAPAETTQEFAPVKRTAVPLEDFDDDDEEPLDDYDDVPDYDEDEAENSLAKVAGAVGAGVASVFGAIGSGIGSFFKSMKRKGISKTAKWAFLAIILAVVLACLVMCYANAVETYKYNQMDIREIDESDLMVNDGVKAAVEGYTTIALYGVDSRDENLDAGTNSDAIILVSINDETKDVKLVSVYRDTLVQIQSDSLTTQKVNYAYQLGGSLMSINTLNVNFDLYITDYITVDFSALAEIIDAMGGVTVTVTENEINNLNKNLAEQIKLSGTYSDGVHEAGEQTLNGQQAVAYSRIRSTGQGDITRTERQRNVLLALFETAQNASASSISNLVDTSFECISTSFTKKEINTLLKSISQYTVSETTGFPFNYEFASLSGKGSVISAADLTYNVELLHELLYGDSSYSVSSTVSELSTLLTNETGTTKSEGTSSSSATDTSSSSSADTSATTITDAPDGMIENE